MTVQICGRGASGVVYSSADGKTVYKQFEEAGTGGFEREVTVLTRSAATPCEQVAYLVDADHKVCELTT